MEQYLKGLGHLARGQQLNDRIVQPVAAAMAQPSAEQHATLSSSDQIDKLKRNDTRSWCSQLGLRVRGTVPELKARLKEHFKSSGNSLINPSLSFPQNPG